MSPWGRGGQVRPWGRSRGVAGTRSGAGVVILSPCKSLVPTGSRFTPRQLCQRLVAQGPASSACDPMGKILGPARWLGAWLCPHHPH